MLGRKSIRTNGYYGANKKGFSDISNSEYNLYYILKFNPNGLVAYLESDNEPLNPSYEELFEFDSINEFEDFCDISRYSLKGSELTIRLYQPDDNYAYENGIVNEKNYVEWVGIIKDEDSIILSFRKSYYNDALMDYTIDYFFKGLEFRFIQVLP